MTFEVANTDYGPVKGVKPTTCLGRDFYKFSSVPFMKAPLGSLRFHDPVSPEEWTGSLDVTSATPHFISMNYLKEIDGIVDAGVLSVSTPYLDRKLPVAVYIPGGGFQKASDVDASNSPDYLLQKDIVYVVLNYRVGPMGFLSLKDPKLGILGNRSKRTLQTLE